MLRVRFLAVLFGSLMLFVGTAGAQTTVGAGGNVTLSNGQQCVPGAQVSVFLTDAAGDTIRLGSALADARGHFNQEFAVPASVARGAGVINVDCGLDGDVLSYDVIIGDAATGSNTMMLAGGAGAGVLLLGGVALAKKGKAKPSDPMAGAAAMTADGVPGFDPGAFDQPAPVAGPAEGTPDFDPAAFAAMPGAEPVAAPEPQPTAPGAPAFDADAFAQPAAAPVEPAPAAAAAAEEEEDDGTEYWIWDVATPHGPRKRVAAVTEQSFYLHEMSDDEFAHALRNIADFGPDAALAGSFYRFALAEITGIARRDDVLVIATGADASSITNIDLAEEASEVVSLIEGRLGPIQYTQSAPAPAEPAPEPAAAPEVAVPAMAAIAAPAAADASDAVPAGEPIAMGAPATESDASGFAIEPPPSYAPPAQDGTGGAIAMGPSSNN